MRPFRFLFMLLAAAFFFFLVGRLLFAFLFIAGALGMAFFTLRAFRRMAGYRSHRYLDHHSRQWWLPPADAPDAYRHEPLFENRPYTEDWLVEGRRIEVK